MSLSLAFTVLGPLCKVLLMYTESLAPKVIDSESSTNLSPGPFNHL